MTIEERFEKIERKNEDLEKQNQALKNQTRKLRRLSLTSIALAMAALIGGTALSVRAYTASIEPQTISTTRIVLKDANNKARLSLNGIEGTVISYDTNGRQRVRLDPDGNVTSYDANGKLRAGLSSLGVVYVADENGKQRGNMNSGGIVGALDSNGVVRVALGGSAGKVHFYNASGQVVANYPQ